MTRTSGHRPRLVCLLPVRNGSDDLPGWFRCVERFADAVVALDDGSTDDTARLLESHPLVETVLSNPVREDFAGWDDAENRARLLAEAAKLAPDWIFSLDVDERLDETDAAALREFADTDALSGLAYGFRVCRMIHDLDHYDRDDLWVFRLFSFEPGQAFPAQRLHFAPIPISIPASCWIKTSLRIQHMASISEERRGARFAKYTQADPDEMYQSGYSHLLDLPQEIRRWVPRGPDTPVLVQSVAPDHAPDDLDGPLLSAIVISRDDERRIERCLRSVVSQRCPHSFEVIAVVSGHDRTADIVRQKFPDVRLVRLPRPALPGQARNAGLKVARGEYVSFPGSHVELVEGSLAARMQAHEDGWEMVTGTTLNGTHTPAGWAAYFLDHSGVLPDRPSGELAAAPSHCSYMRHLLDRVGGFPEDRRAGEDTVVNTELFRMGFRAYRSAEAQLIHHNPCDTPWKLVRHHFVRGRAWGQILRERRPLRRRRSVLRQRFLLRYVPSRMATTSRNVRAWGGSLRPAYRRCYPLALMAVVAAWAGTWYEPLRRAPRSPTRSRVEELIRRRGPALQVASLGWTVTHRCRTAVRAVLRWSRFARGVSRLAQSSRLWEQLDVQIARKELDLDQATNTVLNVLVVGSDSRAQLTSRRDVERFGQNVGQRADTMMLCQIDVSGERGAIFSLPRDLWVPAPDNGQRPPHGLAKLGDVYGRGAQNLIEAVRRLTQLPIHHYVEVEMSGFRRLIEAVGGIRVRIEDHFYDPVLRFWLPPGTHTLDGDRALSYVRARNATSGYDEDRIKRQQEFVRALLAQVGRPRVLAHPFRFRELAHAAVQSLTVDSGLRLQDLAAIALKLRRVDSDRLVTCAPPIREKEIDGRVGAEIDGTAHEPFLARLRAPFVGAEPARQASVPTPAASTITPTGGVALTFDDGPHPTFTPRIMDILEARGVRGTFFLIGRQAQKHPDLVRSIASRGHTVGGHTWSHRILTTISDADWYFEVEYTNELLRELSGQSVPYIRPPQGKQDARTLGKLRAAGLVSVRWTKDTEDWTNPGADVIVRRAVGGLRPGAVVLMHDGGGNRDQTVDALERILDGIAGAGLEVQPLALMYRRFTA